MQRIFAALVVLLFACGGARASQYRIDHLEPPCWWTGMQDKTLQLMVHGPHIGELEPALNYPGVRITAVRPVANKNYLFIDLSIDEHAKAGQFDIVFGHGDSTLKYNYQLLARAPGSRERAGFNSSDAIYELMPDRFANGKPDNDS